MDALILTGEPLPLPGAITNGAGLCAWGLFQALRSAGLDARVATRRMAMEDLTEEDAAAHHTLLWEPTTIASQIDDWDPACVVAQHWGVLREIPPLAPPLAIDLAGPHLLERQLWGAEDWAEQLEEKLAALRRADFVVCSGERQRLYFLNHLALAGFDLTEQTLPVIPFSADPGLPPTDRHEPSRLLYAGMFLPWQDPSAVLEAAIDVLAEERRGELLFRGGPHPRLDVSRGRFDDLTRRLENAERVVCKGLAGFDEYLEDLAVSGVALDVMARNPERELAFATRTVLYLWAGLPVIHSDHDELGALIAEHGAGWVVASDDTEGLRAAIREALRSPDLVRARGANAQRLVRERLTWDKTIAPLAQWCRHPTRRAGKDALILAFEAKDREIRDLRRDLEKARSALATIEGKLSWRLTQRVLTLRWLWAALVWIALLPVALLIALALTMAELLPRRRDAKVFPPPPSESGRA